MALIHASSAETRIPIVEWMRCTTAPDAAASPRDLPRNAEWFTARAPGLVGGAGADEMDHWYRARLEPAAQSRILFEGLATICDIFVDDDKRAASASMFAPVEIDIDKTARDLWLCFRALAPRLAAAPKRSRWRPAMIQPNALRYFRTTALGSMPGWAPIGRPVGPWRPVTLVHPRENAAHRIDSLDLRARYDGEDGAIDVALAFSSPAAPTEVRLQCAGASAALACDADGLWRATLALPAIAPWMPHTHGEPHLHGMTISIDGATFDCGRTGFRRIEIDRDADGDGFGLVVNGIPVFCRGASWASADIATLAGDRATIEPWLRLARDAGMNMIRVSGVTVYESDAFYELCDELGLLVWQDMMLANFDYPQSEAVFATAIETEALSFLDRTQISPSLAILCGGSEVFQQAAMLGAPRELWSGPVFDQIIPRALQAKRPDLAYVPNSPSGGALPFVADVGVTHYYGVGAYQRDLDDARRARVRFASECLAFANVPEEMSLVAANIPPHAHHPAWKEGVPRDVGASWDFDDIRDHYLGVIYKVSPQHLRREDPERYLELSRAVVPIVMEAVFAEWRRPASPTRGGLVWMLQDVKPGAGWGVISSDGRPKSAWFGLKRAFRPIQLALTDEGVNGLHAHLINETPDARDLELNFTCYRDGATPVASASRALRLDARSGVTLRSFELFQSFFDITYAYRFGPPSHHATHARLTDSRTGELIADAFHFPLRLDVQRRETGLKARLIEDGERPVLELSCDRLAQGVHIVDDAADLSDNWFNLAPGRPRRVALSSRNGAPPRGLVRAVNAIEEIRYPS